MVKRASKYYCALCSKGFNYFSVSAEVDGLRCYFCGVTCLAKYQEHMKKKG